MLGQPPSDFGSIFPPPGSCRFPVELAPHAPVTSRGPYDVAALHLAGSFECQTRSPDEVPTLRWTSSPKDSPDTWGTSGALPVSVSLGRRPERKMAPNKRACSAKR